MKNLLSILTIILLFTEFTTSICLYFAEDTDLDYIHNLETSLIIQLSASYLMVFYFLFKDVQNMENHP